MPPALPVGLEATGVLAHDPASDQWLLTTAHHVVLLWRGSVTRRWNLKERSSALALWRETHESKPMNGFLGHEWRLTLQP